MPPKMKKKRTFFDVEENPNQQQLEQYHNKKTQIKLEFTITGIQSGHRYQIHTTFIELNDKFLTEAVNSHGNIITFNKCKLCDFYFEKEQIINITLIKDSMSEGFISIPLGQIVGSSKKPFESPIGKNGTKIIITTEEIMDSKSYLDVQFDVQRVSLIDFNKPKYRFYYVITSNERKVYSSESLSWYGRFEPVKIPVALIQNGFTITFLDNNNNCLGFTNQNLDTIVKLKDQFLLSLMINGKKLNIVNRAVLIKNISFIDYIRKGVTIKLNIGIDYTSTNRPPNDPLSYHYLEGENDYEQAIKACGIIIAYYDYNQLFPVYGYGAIIENQQIPNMCFNVNLKNNPEIYTIDNVIKEYHNSFKHLILAGPSNFSPLINHVLINIKRENNPLKYHILLILTDGIINDMFDTIDSLVEGSFLPLSVIIIGIGNNNFKDMEQLDGDQFPLINSRGVKRMRDHVHFVPFNKYKYNPKLLAEKVLEEIPRQIIEYYTMNNITPDNLESAQIISQSNYNNNNYVPNSVNKYAKN